MLQTSWHHMQLEVFIVIAILTSSLGSAERVSDELWFQDAKALLESQPAPDEDSSSYSAMEAREKELRSEAKQLKSEDAALRKDEREYQKDNEDYGYASAALSESLKSFANSVDGFRSTISEVNRKSVEETKEVMKAPMKGGLGGEEEAEEAQPGREGGQKKDDGGKDDDKKQVDKDVKPEGNDQPAG
mmetsp:Transcript_91121/g.162195  ORF Transcript_91121/g.162195 Transcript_91121/m.162195 type:complete len:188 (-) Transcript_91121:49-612(-)